MTGEMIFSALESIDDSYILAVAEFLENRRAAKRPVRYSLIAAVLISLLLAACAAAVCFDMFLSQKEEHPREKLEELWLDYEDMGLIVSFSGPEECHMAGFKANWLPTDIYAKDLHDDGIWYRRIVDETDDDAENPAVGAIPYNISISYVSSDYQLVFGGDTTVVKDESKGKLRIVELISEISQTEYGRSRTTCNWILIFDSENGYLITMFSTLYDMAELERMVANMEIHVYTETIVPKSGRDYVVSMPGRG